MENSGSYIFCTVCQTRLKRQVLGSNIFYYCRNCGYLSSEANFSEKIIEFHAQEPLSTQKTPSVTDLKISKDAQKNIFEA
jgi:hypothetical protein